MSRGYHGPLRALAVGAGALLCLAVASVVAVSAFINSAAFPRYIGRIASRYVDGTVEVGDAHLEGIESLSLELGGLSVVYPHGSFAVPDSTGTRSLLLQTGCSASADTLLSLERLKAEFSLARYLFKHELEIPGLTLSGPRLFYRVFDDSTSSLDVLKLPGTAGSAAKPGPVNLTLGRIEISGDPAFYLSDYRQDAFISACFDTLAVDGRFVMDDSGIDLGGIGLRLGSLLLAGSLPKDTLSASVSLQKLAGSDGNLYAIRMDGLAEAGTAWGKARVPAVVDCLLEIGRDGDGSRVDIRHFESRIANVPLSAEGRVNFFPDSTYLDLSARIKDCSLDKVFADFSSLLRSFPVWAGGRLSAEAHSCGVLAQGRTPSLSAHVSMPGGTVLYKPEKYSGQLSFDAYAEMDANSRLTARIPRLRLSGRDYDLKLSGRVADILGRNPVFNLKAGLSADLSPLSGRLDQDIPVDVDGRIGLDMTGRASLSQIKSMHFNKDAVSGHLVSDTLHMYVPDDTMTVRSFNPYVTFTSDQGGLHLNFLSDSILLTKGSGMSAKLRGSTVVGTVTGVPSPEGTAIGCRVRAMGDSLFFRTGDSRFFAGGADIIASAEGLSENREDMWNLSADLSVDDGSAALPALPIRTRFEGLRARYDGRDFVIDTIGLHCGTSDFGISALAEDVKGMAGGGKIKFKADIDAGRFNLNEILAALDTAKVIDVAGLPDEDDSFVRDSIVGVVPELPPLVQIIVPEKVDAEMSVDLRNSEFLFFQIDSTHANLSMRDRSVQLLDSGLSSKYGNVEMDAFYHASCPDDIATGVNLKVDDIDAGKIIRLLPGFDGFNPVIRSFNGTFDCLASITTQLDSSMRVVAPSLNGTLHLDGTDVNVADAGKMRLLTTLLLFENLNIGDVDDFHADAVAHNGQIEFLPFEFGVDRYKLALWGTQGLDSSIYYHLSLLRAPLFLRFGINMYGKLGNWKFDLTPAKYKEGGLPSFTSELNSMQTSVAQYVRNFRTAGVENISSYYSGTRRRLLASRMVKEFDTGTVQELSFEEYSELDPLLFELELSKMEADLSDQVDAILELSYVETNWAIGKYLLDYRVRVFDKRIKQNARKKVLSKLLTIFAGS